MKFSLIVGTYNNFTDLPHLLESLVSQTYENFEVIVVDQNDSSETIQAQCRRYAPHINIHYIHTNERGLSRARNLGIQQATGDILCFPDDDCIYLPTTLIDVKTVFETNPSCDIVSISARHPITKRLLSYTPHPLRQPITGSSFIFYLITSIGLFVKKNTVLFDPDFGVGGKYNSCEEFDYVIRLLAQGKTGEYIPEISVLHPEPDIEPSRYALKIYRNAVGHGAFFRKHFSSFPVSKMQFLYFYILFVKPVLGWLYYKVLRNQVGAIRQKNYLLGRIAGYCAYERKA